MVADKFRKWGIALREDTLGGVDIKTPLMLWKVPWPFSAPTLTSVLSNANWTKGLPPRQSCTAEYTLTAPTVVYALIDWILFPSDTSNYAILVPENFRVVYDTENPILLKR